MHIHVQDTVITLEEGTPPPTMVPLVGHAGTVEGFEWQTH